MKKWTVMFYLAGDNNLSEDMITSLLGIQRVMKATGADRQVNLVAIYDSGYPTAPITTYNFTNGNTVGELEKSTVTLRPGNFQRDHSQNKDTAYIIGFVESVAIDPDLAAENYALILSGHSDAILGKTMFRDSNPDSKLHLAYLAKILVDAAAKLPKNKFDILGFDSCMMGMLEVGCQLDKAGNVLVSSQGFAPTAGWDYFEILKDLIAQNGEINPIDFGISIVNNQIDSAKNYRIGGRSMNLSAVDLTKAEDLNKSVNKLAKVFNDILASPVKVYAVTTEEQAKTNAVMIECIKNLIQNTHYYSQTFLHEQAVDILDFINTLSSNCDLKLMELELLLGNNTSSSAGTIIKDKLNLIKDQCPEIKQGLNDYVKKNRSAGSEYQFCEGVSIFFPWTMLALNMVFRRYVELDFSIHSEWIKFIETFTTLTLRANGEPRFESTTDYLKWKGDVAAANKASTAKDTDDTRASTAKASTAKAETDMFYKFFGRFRNHPIFHEVGK